MQLKLNKYTVFYFLLLCGLVLYSLPPKYNGPIYGGGPAFIVVPLIFLFFSLPCYFILLVLVDFFRRKFKVIVLNLIIFTLSLLITYWIKKYILITSIYDS